MNGSPKDPLNLADVPNERPSAEAAVDTASARKCGKGKHSKKRVDRREAADDKLRSAVSETIQHVLRCAEEEGPSNDPQHSQPDVSEGESVSGESVLSDTE